MSLDFKLPKGFNGRKIADAVESSLNRLGRYQVVRTENNGSISIDANGFTRTDLSFRVSLHSNASYSHLMFQGDQVQNRIPSSLTVYLLEELAK